MENVFVAENVGSMSEMESCYVVVLYLHDHGLCSVFNQASIVSNKIARGDADGLLDDP